MATSLCRPIATSFRLSFEHQPPIFAGAAAPGGWRRRIGYSMRPSLSSRARQRDFQPGPLLGSLMALDKLSVRCGAVKTIGQSEFAGEVLGSDIPVLVEFVADWCGPCRLISPLIEWASQEYSGRLNIVKIDHDANPELIEEYKIYGLPALILFKNGQEVPESRREGAITKIKLKEYLDSLLGSASVV